MEIMYPLIILICIVIVLLIWLVPFNKKVKYTQGKKIANTKYVEQTNYFKIKLKKYKILSNVVKSLSSICIIIIGILIARPITVQNEAEEKYNRDIIIGLDISTSESEVNLELIQKFKQIISGIQGDRIGIVIFNTSPVVACPLTDDYEYVESCLDKIENQLQLVVNNNGNIPYTSTSYDSAESFSFWYGGAVYNNNLRGSSLVGDGLSRIIIFFSRVKNR